MIEYIAIRIRKFRAAFESHAIKPFSPIRGEKGWDEGGDEVVRLPAPPSPQPLSLHRRERDFNAGLCLLIPVFCLLTACSLYQPSALPSRDGIMPGETIAVEGNQNVYAVARKYSVSMRELIVLNNIKAPFTLRSGQRLTLPANKVSGEAYMAGGMPPVSGAATAPVEEAALPPIQVPTFSSSAKPGPQPGNSVIGAPVTSAPVEALNTPSPPPKPLATTVSGSTHVASVTPPSSTESIPTPSMSFSWPVQGPILSAFGPKGQGLSNDGINIVAPKGAPVVAAANGIVAYAGNEMKGFGNLVLIRHQGGWVTAYAHLDRALVNKDAVVARGDMIGTVGKTGNVPSPQLHFETRFNGKPVDPSGVIKSQ